MAGWGDLVGKIAQQFQGRIERLKNEKAKLEIERRTLEIFKMDINKPEDRKKATRLGVIIDRIAIIDRLLGNQAKD